MKLELKINGSRQSVETTSERSLLHVLREDLGLTGAKYGCGEGQCGACTVLLDGSPARSCVTRASAVGSREITTIEGLEQNGRLHPVQQAFLDADALQCGYCTPGMILGAVALLKSNPRPSTDHVADALKGHMCRCGAYPRIVAAVRRRG